MELDLQSLFFWAPCAQLYRYRYSNTPWKFWQGIKRFIIILLWLFIFSSSFQFMSPLATRLKSEKQCCGSGMLSRIPDPNFSIPDRGSRDKKIPGSGCASASKNFSILSQKSVLSSRKYDSGCSSRPDLGSGSWFFTHPGSNGQKGTGSRIWFRNTAEK